MASQAKILANQSNAQFSTGPKTPATKSISAQNSRGPIANFLLSTENPDEYRTFTEEISATYEPQNALERSLVSEIVTVRWRLARYAAMETALLENALRKMREQFGPDADNITLIAAALEHLIENSKTFNTLRRYQREDQRAFYRADKKLLEMMSLGETDEQNEANSEVEALRFLMSQPMSPAMRAVSDSVRDEYFASKAASAQAVKPNETAVPAQLPEVTTA